MAAQAVSISQVRVGVRGGTAGWSSKLETALRSQALQLQRRRRRCAGEHPTAMSEIVLGSLEATGT